MKNKAFTLAEITIVLSIIGVLAVMLIGAMNKLQPNKPKVMFKKAYEITERTVGELVNDESIYPYDPERIGFYNTDRACVEGTSDCFNGVNKFRKFFARKLNILANVDWSKIENHCNEDNYKCHFQTSDGICWCVPRSFADPETNRQITIVVDINGDKKPNSFDNVEKDRDRFRIYVSFDGRIRVPSKDGDREAEFLRSHNATGD